MNNFLGAAVPLQLQAPLILIHHTVDLEHAGLACSYITASNLIPIFQLHTRPS